MIFESRFWKFCFVLEDPQQHHSFIVLLFC